MTTPKAQPVPAQPLPDRGGRYYRKADGSIAAAPAPKPEAEPASTAASTAPSKPPSKEA